jgi:hypothetical protein
MRCLRVGILDLVAKSPNPSLYGRVMNANLASIMPQVIAVWCEEAGHDVHLVCYTGVEDLLAELPPNVDLLFIGAFTEAAQLAYALSHLFQRRGTVTALGGPHARCYPRTRSSTSTTCSGLRTGRSWRTCSATARRTGPGECSSVRDGSRGS